MVAFGQVAGSPPSAAARWSYNLAPDSEPEIFRMFAVSATAQSQAIAPERSPRELVVVLDFGSQYAQLIARRVREQHTYCEILRHDIPAKRLQQLAPKGIILSGGPASVYAENAPKCDPELFELGIPVLGICYGINWCAKRLGPTSTRHLCENSAGRTAKSRSATHCLQVCRKKPTSG